MTLRAMLAALVVVLGCTEPSDRAVGSVNFPKSADGQAGVATPLAVQVLDRNGTPKSEVRVRWSPSPGAGTVTALESFTDFQGMARTQWIPSETVGATTISIEVDQQHSATVPATIRPGLVEQVKLSTDSVRLTRSQGQHVRIRTFDKFGNEHVPPSFEGLTVGWTKAVRAGFHVDSLLLFYSGIPLRDTGTVFVLRVPLQQSSPLPVLATLKVTVDIVVASVQLFGLDDNHLAAGQALPYRVVAMDSSQRELDVSSREAGVVLSSSDSSIVGVDTSGQLIGRKVGFATVTASSRSETLAARVEVMQAYDLGALRTLYAIPPRTNDRYHEGVRFAPSGRSIGFQQFFSADTFTYVAWRDQDGSFIAQRSYGGLRQTGITPTGASFLTNPLTYHNANAVALWTRQAHGRVTADSTLLVVSTTSGLVAFSATGDSLWRYAPAAQTDAVMLTAQRIYLSNGLSLVALDRSGAPLWTRAIEGILFAADASGRAFLAGSQSVIAIDSTGQQLWSVAQTQPAGVPLATVAQDNMLVLSSRGVLRAIDRTSGTVRWSAKSPWVNAMTAAESRLLLINDYVHVFDLVTGQRLGRTIVKAPGLGLTCTAAGLAFWWDNAMIYPRCF